MSATCRYCGISRTGYYKWLKRYDEEGFEGLKDRSSAPHNSSKATQAEVVEKTLWLRQRYHFGPGKISMYLQRYHEIRISPSGVWRILHKAGVNRRPASQRYKRHEARWKRYRGVVRPRSMRRNCTVTGQSTVATDAVDQVEPQRLVDAHSLAHGSPTDGQSRTG